MRDIKIPNDFQAPQGELDKCAFYDWFNTYWQVKDDVLVAELKKCSMLEMSQKNTIKKGNGLQS